MYTIDIDNGMFYEYNIKYRRDVTVLRKILIFCLSILLIFSFTACSPVDEDYGVVSSVSSEDNAEHIDVGDTKIMSSDRVMSKYFDISLFDEENYSNIYLGNKFDIDAIFGDFKFEVPVKIEQLKEDGWRLAEGNKYDENSLVFAYETIDATITNDQGNVIAVQFYNSSRSSVKLSKCYIVKYKIENYFYKNVESYAEFNINGITNTMAITDVINTLGTPSHFYKVSENSYYLDYFISRRDRRNGITVYLDPIEDLVTAVEFSYYK